MSLFVDIESLVSAKLDVMKTAVSILKLETRLAGLSVYPLLLNLCLLLIGLMGVWTSTMIAIGYMLTLLIPNILGCIGIVVLLNTGVVFGLLRYLSFNLKNMSFEKTRQYLAHQESRYVQPTKKSYPRNCQNGGNLTLQRATSRSKKK